ncbi:MAG: HAD-IIIC family phosphatase, partial [Clostridia bacterium]|nr:HAD-IIIC family phosphatase [Clostridia bacterium]
GQYWNDGMFPPEELASFRPDVIYVHTSFRNLTPFLPSPSMTPEECVSKCDEAYRHFSVLWEKLAEDYHCPVIQNNFEYPGYRLMGNRDGWDRRGVLRFVRELNERFAEYAEHAKSFYLNDIDYVSSCYGLDRWLDDSVWYLYKYACALDAIPYWSFNLARIIKSLFGKNKKALALDLDNTLWGGVVGDDGVDGIELGSETATGECFLAFQNYLKSLKGIGIMLTVDSKNDLENALAGLRHPDSVLTPEEFIVIKASWETKDRNLAETASRMDLGVDSFVFADDNPTERALVRASLPGVAVPDMDSPYDYIRVLDWNGYFETTAFSEDDVKRNEMYKANAERAVLQESFTDYTEYLRSLDMDADILPFPELYIPRITQLTNKSNQFNLTTKRYTEDEIRAAAADPDRICLYGKLRDRFGDNGVVSVVIGSVRGDELHMDLWLMSCRVLKKDMEFAMLDTLVKTAREKGVKSIFGYYYPTAKNGMVKDLYRTFGFEKRSESADGSTVWELRTDGYENRNRVIRVNA